MRSAQPNTRAPVDRAFGILQAFPAGGTATLGELARRTGYPKTTVHDLLAPLIRAGAVERDGDRLRLGLLLFELGMRVPQRHDLRSLALPRMQELMAVTGGTVHLAVRDRTDVLYLEKLVGPRTAPAPSVVGGRMSMHLSAIGKAILAYSTSDLIADVARAGLSPETAATITSERALLGELHRIRLNGLAFDRGELRPDLACVGAPIRDRAGMAVGGISVAVPSRDPALGLVRAAATVRAAAAALSEAYDAAG